MRRYMMLSPLLLLLSLFSWQHFNPRPPNLRLNPDNTDRGLGSLVVISPHPDDESLGTSGLIQDALLHGQPVYVITLTNGDGFRLEAERWLGRFGPSHADMIAFGRHRQQESLSALEALGLTAHEAIFLGYPDGGLASMWLTHWDRSYRSSFTSAESTPYRPDNNPHTGRALLDEMVGLFAELIPSVVVYPHPQDAHSDHWATYNFARAALEQLRGIEGWIEPDERLYLVHRGEWPAPKGLLPEADLLPPRPLADGMTTWMSHELSAEQVRIKETAIRQHRTPIALMKRYMLSFARKTELYGRVPPILMTLSDLNVDHWTEVLNDPAGDTVTRDLTPSADVVGIDMQWVGNEMKVRLRVRSAPSRRVVYYLTVREFHAVTGWHEPVRLTWRPGAASQYARAVGSTVEFDVPARYLTRPDSFMIGAETRVDGLFADRTATRLVRTE